MAKQQQDGDIANADLAKEGVVRIEWAEREMPVLRGIRERFSANKPLAGVKILACLHVTTETANLILTLKGGGAEIRLCASNPLSTQDDVTAAMLHAYDVPTWAISGESTETYSRHLNEAIAFGPNITVDDGADLVALLHV